MARRRRVQGDVCVPREIFRGGGYLYGHEQTAEGKALPLLRNVTLESPFFTNHVAAAEVISEIFAKKSIFGSGDFVQPNICAGVTRLLNWGGFPTEPLKFQFQPLRSNGALYDNAHYERTGLRSLWDEGGELGVRAVFQHVSQFNSFPFVLTPTCGEAAYAWISSPSAPPEVRAAWIYFCETQVRLVQFLVHQSMQHGAVCGSITNGEFSLKVYMDNMLAGCASRAEAEALPAPAPHHHPMLFSESGTRATPSQGGAFVDRSAHDTCVLKAGFVTVLPELVAATPFGSTGRIATTPILGFAVLASDKWACGIRAASAQKADVEALIHRGGRPLPPFFERHREDWARALLAAWPAGRAPDTASTVGLFLRRLRKVDSAAATDYEAALKARAAQLSPEAVDDAAEAAEEAADAAALRARDWAVVRRAAEARTAAAAADKILLASAAAHALNETEISALLKRREQLSLSLTAAQNAADARKAALAEAEQAAVAACAVPLSAAAAAQARVGARQGAAGASFADCEAVLATAFAGLDSSQE